ncbi:MAG: hypothetical protein KBD78_05310 [Oligoflexales bacterium]|nr:hypothetical protein [Oligoflexales bacterium]
MKYNWTELKLSEMYSKISNYYPEIILSQYNSLLDFTQQAFFSFMGGNPLAWGKQVVQQMRDISANSDRFRYFLNKDFAHCATFSDSFYKRGHGKLKLHTWLSEFINGDNVANIEP